MVKSTCTGQQIQNMKKVVIFDLGNVLVKLEMLRNDFEEISCCKRCTEEKMKRC